MSTADTERDVRLRGIGKRAEAATGGQWTATEGTLWERDENEVAQSSVRSDGSPITWDDHDGEVFKPADAAFIAHARADVPWLLSEVTNLDGIVDQVLDLHQPETRTVFVPVFDEFDSPTQVQHGCSCGHRTYPCPTRSAIEGGES